VFLDFKRFVLFFIIDLAVCLERGCTCQGLSPDELFEEVKKQQQKNTLRF